MSDPSPDDLVPSHAPGDRIDRFDVIEVLGEGGMAHVYKVRHRTLGTVHALKCLHTTHPSLAARLVQEGRVQAHLDHPNVVSVTDIVELDHAIGLVMQFVEGRTLQDRLEAEGALATGEALRLFRGLLAGVQAAHAAGVLHRDLKPANVLLAPGPEGEVPRIADFGLAKDVTGTHATSKTRTGLGMGTPGYAPPEQWADSSSVDVRTDVFALGAILYEMLAGHAPFAADSRVGVLERTMRSRYPALGDAVPEGVARAIARALAADPGDRFPTVAAFRDALAEAPAEPATRAEEPRPATRRPPAATAVPPPGDADTELFDDASTAGPDSDGTATEPFDDASARAAEETPPAEATPPPGPEDPAGPPLADREPAPPPEAVAADEGSPPQVAPPPVRSLRSSKGARGLVGATLVGTLLAGALVAVLGGAGLVWALGGGDEPEVCSGWWGHLGYYNAGPVFLPKQGQDHRLIRRVQVHRDRPREGSDWEPGPVRCYLPAGTELHLAEDPVRLRGAVWVPVRARAITLPEE